MFCIFFKFTEKTIVPNLHSLKMIWIKITTSTYEKLTNADITLKFIIARNNGFVKKSFNIIIGNFKN